MEEIEQRLREMIDSGKLKDESTDSIPIPIPIPINSTAIPKQTTPTPTTSIRLTALTPTPEPTRKRKAKPNLLSNFPEVTARKIASYHKDSVRRCLADYANDTHHKNYCPCLPTEFRA